MSCTVLLIFIIVCSAAPTGGQEKVFPNHGISIEARGQVLYSQNAISIPAVLSLGNLSHFFITPNLTGCELSQSWGAASHIKEVHKAVKANIGSLFEQGYQEALEAFVCDRFDELCHGNRTDPHPIRQRRFLFSLGAMIGAGVGTIGYWMYNRIAGYDASSAIADMKHSFEDIKKEVEKMAGSQLIQTKALRKMWAYSISLRKDMEMLRVKMRCHQIENQQEASYLQLLSILPNQFHRAINSLIKSDVTPDLISYDQVKHLIKEHPALKNTLYSKDYALFYQLSHAIPVMIDQDQLSLYFLLQVPHLAPESLGVLYEIYNFGVYSPDHHVKIDSPQYFSKFLFPNQAFQYFPVVPSECHKTPGVWVCGYGGININEHSGCVTEIMHHNNFTQCKVQVRKNAREESILTTSSGVFIYTPRRPFTTINYTTWSKVPKFHDPTEKTIFLPLSTFDELIVGNQHVQGHRYNFSIPIITTAGFQFPSLSYDNYSMIPYDWREVDQISLEINRTIESTTNVLASLSRLSSPSYWYSHSVATITIILVFVFLISLFCYIRRSTCKVFHKKIGRRTNRDEIALAFQGLKNQGSIRSPNPSRGLET